MGYAGGSLRDPTYRHMGDHSETVQIDFDPSQLSYERLLEIFWESHAPEEPAYGRQYMSAIFAGDAAQLEAARTSKSALEARRRRALHTEIEPLERFYRAEDYHQKYYLRQHPELMRAFAGYTPQAFADSSVAARLNGFVGRYGTAALLENERESYGLPAEVETALRPFAGRRRLP